MLFGKLVFEGEKNSSLYFEQACKKMRLAGVIFALACLFRPILFVGMIAFSETLPGLGRQQWLPLKADEKTIRPFSPKNTCLRQLSPATLACRRWC